MIDRIEITNFKAFAHAVVPLGRYTLLTGLNSSGKSTLLQALALLRQSRDLLTEQDGGFLLNGSLIELGTGQDLLHEYYVSSGDAPTPQITVALDRDGRTFTWAAAYEREADLLQLVEPSEAREEDLPALFGDRFQYLRADRISPAVTHPRSHEQAVRHGFLGAHGEHTVNYLRHFQDEPVADERLHHPQARSRRLLDQAEAWMQDISPGVNLQADMVDGTDLVRLSFRFGTAGLSSTNRYRPTHVGFGLTYVLPVIVACLSAQPGGLIMLENPEAHLHPRGQTAMTALTCAAAMAGAQVMVETHSDHVLNAIRLAVKQHRLAAEDVMVHFFERRRRDPNDPEDVDETRIVTPTIGPDGMLSQWPDGFFDEWDRSLDQLLD